MKKKVASPENNKVSDIVSLNDARRGVKFSVKE